MRFVDESLSAIHHTSYPDTHHVDANYSIPLDSVSLCGIQGQIPYYLPQDNLGEDVSSHLDNPPAFAWMTPVDQQLANDFSPSQPFIQYADPILFYPPTPPDEHWVPSSSLSQWDDVASHSNSPSMLGYYLHQSPDDPGAFWPGPNAMAAGLRLDDFSSETATADHANAIVWSDGVAARCVEQPSYLFADDARHLPTSTVFTDHNLDFGPSARFATSPSCGIYPSPPLSPRPLPHGHDHRPISLPTHGLPASPTINRWKCPHCNYVQGRRRMVDLRRHIATHTKPSDVALWTCCGFPREVARAQGVPDDVLRETSAIYGRVGGCWETFSRRDALQRHLRKQKGRCFGDAYAEWHPGNSNKRDRQAKTRARGDDSYQWDD